MILQKPKHLLFKIHTIFFLLAWSCVLSAQNIEVNNIVSKSAYAEKIYVQLSGTVFTNDETIWLKAIVTNAVNNAPTTKSAALHVELIDFDKRVIDKKLLKLNFGISDTFFQLNETLASGRYLIRAYTEWNKNFEDAFISEQYIDVFKPKLSVNSEKPIRNLVLTETENQQFELSAQVFPEVINPKQRGKLKLHIDMGFKTDSVEIKKNKANIYEIRYLLPENVIKAKLELRLDPIKLKNNNFGFVNAYSESVVINKDYLDLQFFPEGGKLVNNLPSTVAFKALNYDNRGKSIQGTLVDNLGNTLLQFETNNLGMGAFVFTPNSNRRYFGQITDKTGTIYKYPLPEIHGKGYAIRVKKEDRGITIRILSNNYKQDDAYTIKASCRGVNYHVLEFKLKKGKRDIVFQNNSLPEGIIVFTVFNKNKQPILERLFFNYEEHSRIALKAKMHLSNYSQRDKAIINLEALDEDSDAVGANLSVLVLNKDALYDMQNNRNTICSYFLLDAELKGRIENPSQYFDKNNSDRFHDMDALMLTQGWRNYKYERASNPSKPFKYQPEKGIVVSGTVGEYFNSKKKSKKPIELTMVTSGKPPIIGVQQVDSTGCFSFNLGDIYTNDLELLIQSKDHKGKKKNYTINLDDKTPPKISFKKEEKLQLVDSVNTYVAESIERKKADDDFKMSSNTVTLDEVTISGYKMTPEREEMMELYGPPDIVIEDKELHQNIKKWSYSLFSVLMFSYPDDINIRRVDSLVGGIFLTAEAHGADFTFIVIDGKLVDLEDYPILGDLPTEEIKSVEVLKTPKNWSTYFYELFPGSSPGVGSYSIINIYTYSRKGLYGVRRTSRISKNTISGFTPKREFYAPKHEDLYTEDWNEPDLRSVVYWNPNLETDSEGNAKVEFYNSDDIGDMLVVIEAITKEGKIGYYETTYTVEEKLEK